MSIIEKAIAKLNHAKQSNDDSGNEKSSQRKFEKTASSPHSDLQLKFNIETLSAAGIVSPNEQAPYLADEFRRIKRPLLNNAFGTSSELVENGNVIMVTSSLPGEGKSFSAVNLALSIALEKDYTVLLIDADVAMSKITRMFALDKRPGLTDKLENTELDLAELLIKTDFPGLSIIPAGKHTTLATELLSSNVMKDLIKEIANRYSNRIIIFDSPPLLATPESSVLAEQMGQIVLVVEANKTPQSAVMESVGLLNKDKAIGVILNKTSKGFGYAQYGNYYSYGRGA
ncbi:MAG: polysaccharide biosynthesis tyrosine autokinase [Gammaproteobacteria bacterium]|nr:polysaccharide biosynthesis tyrosine autokinase [Gammaproteobacteria bacterium]